MKKNTNPNFYLTNLGTDIDSFNHGQSLLYSNDPRECYYVILKIGPAKRLFIQAKDDEWYGAIPFDVEEEMSEDLLVRVITNLNQRWQRGELCNQVKTDYFLRHFSKAFFSEGGIIIPCDYVS